MDLAAERLYRAFRRYRKPRSLGLCTPHCVPARLVASLLRVDRRELGAEDFAAYVGEVAYAGDDEFGYFLPRLLELHPWDGLGKASGVLLRVGTHPWSPTESAALDGFHLDRWRRVLADPGADAVAFLADARVARPTAAPFLRAWEEDTSDTAIGHLAEFVERHPFGVYEFEDGWDHEVSAWLPGYPVEVFTGRDDHPEAQDITLSW
ncbi:hypothetical protein [Actinosynnema sp. NPDC020468]|uniref:hypothetical protein n=1 Tax=Actinosynnema sp. NPDC020468 TaxID=3154488 RepID=UPI0033F0DB87